MKYTLLVGESSLRSDSKPSIGLTRGDDFVDIKKKKKNCGEDTQYQVVIWIKPHVHVARSAEMGDTLTLMEVVL